MMNELINLMQNQEVDLKQLLELLETQYKMIMSKDVFGLEGLVDKINDCGKKVAKDEIQRRDLVGDESIKVVVSESNNEELKEAYSNIQKTLNEVMLKKETNDMLLKQQIMFNTKMLNMMQPNREIKTYNSYGSLSNKLKSNKEVKFIYTRKFKERVKGRIKNGRIRFTRNA